LVLDWNWSTLRTSSRVISKALWPLLLAPQCSRVEKPIKLKVKAMHLLNPTGSVLAEPAMDVLFV
jgi:hypothetical protein